MRWAIWAAVAGLIAGAAGAREAIAPPGRAMHVATRTYTFDYAYPAAAGRIAGLKAWLDADLDKARADLAFDALNAAAVEGDGATFNPWNQSHDWQVVTDLPGWLSLSGNDEDYEGGAHPTYSNRALLWDKAAQRARPAPLIARASRKTAATPLHSAA